MTRQTKYSKLANKSFASYKRAFGASLLMVMMVLVVVSILGIAGVQLALMSEKGARNDRDMQMAWQSAEAALQDSEFDMRGPGTSTRQSTFDNNIKSAFLPNCGASSSGNSKGLCTPTTFGKAAWLTADFLASDSPTTEFGDFTGRAFDAGSTGMRSAKKPRYMIEILDDTEAFSDLSIGKKKYVYRVTAMGFGPRDDIQAVTQMIFRKE